MKKTSRQLQKEQTKELLIKTAFKLFSERGFLSTRISDIAGAAGVSHGTVFVHFPSLDALMAEVIEVYVGKIAQRTHELADSGKTLREVLCAHLNGIQEYEPFYTALVTENRQLPPPARDAWVTLQSVISLHFSRAVQRETEAGKIIPIPTSLLFNMWLGLVHHYLANTDLFAPGGKVIERYGETLIDNYLKLLASKGAE
ncbi:TetR/AcrR family transcriptional regulator [Caproiciproducens faecalis]|uniref:TetR/AcrR family transcriptional regulator n=1 Tax=Caproiciproducens faecalis TaxID=2820301 RepID=A0ABS7DLY0_9FIRM|nr:TetR/AcrR family transcriptional regulator [Caproiciproducens faecalis]MBW7572304.1 TetR/AcrR family transcriptional regulator [Caproiciproducens faecalis]